MLVRNRVAATLWVVALWSYAATVCAQTAPTGEAPPAPPAMGQWHAASEPNQTNALPSKQAPSGEAFQVEPRLSIAELESIALSHNPTLEQSARRVEAARGKQLQSGLYPNPVAGYIGDEIGQVGRAGQQGAFVNQEIVTAGKLRLNRAVAGHEVEQARWEMETQRHRVINDVRIAAYDVVAVQQLVQINEELVRIGEEGLRAAELLQRAKEVAKVDVLQARVEANSARLQLENARNAHLAAWRKLAVVVGTPDLPPAPIDETLARSPNELVWESSLSKLLSESPELAKARAEVDRARCAWARESAGRIPNINLEGGVRYDNSSGYNVGMLQIGVPIPLFDRNQGNLYRAQSELAAAQSDVRRVELALQGRLAEAFKAYSNARQQVDRYGREILPDAKETLDLTRKGYQQGEFGYLQLLTAQRSYFQANRGHVEGLHDLWTSTTHIEGLLLTGGLEAPGRP